MNDVESEVEKAKRVIAAAERREAIFEKATDLISNHLGLSLRECFRNDDYGSVQYALLSPTGKEVAVFSLSMDRGDNVCLSGWGHRSFDWIGDMQLELRKLNREPR